MSLVDDWPDPVTGGALFPPGLLCSSVDSSLNPKPKPLGLGV